MKKWIFFVILIIISLKLPAQEGMIPPKTGGFVNFGLSYQQWTSEGDDENINQIVVPVGCFYPINSSWFLNVTNSPASASYADYSISGLSDTWIRTTYVSADERWMFNLGVGAPTGQTKLNDEEYALTRLLSENVLRFRLPNYGQGFNVKAGAGMAFPMQGGTVLGLGFNYIVKQSYDLWSGFDSEYDPGDEINIVAGLSVPVGQQGKWSTDLVYTMYSADKMNKLEFLDAGDKILISTSLAYKLRSGFIYAALRFRQRGKNELFPGPDQSDEASVSRKTVGDQIETDGLWEFTRWSKGGLSVIWDGRFYGENEFSFGKATVYGLGLGVQHGLSSKVSVRLQMKLLTGTLQSATVTQVNGVDVLSIYDIDIDGIDVLAGLRIKI